MAERNLFTIDAPKQDGHALVLASDLTTYLRWVRTAPVGMRASDRLELVKVARQFNGARHGVRVYALEGWWVPRTNDWYRAIMAQILVLDAEMVWIL